MMTYVLVLISSLYYGEHMVVIPGYSNEASCELAAADYRRKMRKDMKHRAFCIPGPVTNREPTS